MFVKYGRRWGSRTPKRLQQARRFDMGQHPSGGVWWVEGQIPLWGGNLLFPGFVGFQRRRCLCAEFVDFLRCQRLPLVQFSSIVWWMRWSIGVPMTVGSFTAIGPGLDFAVYRFLMSQVGISR